MTSVATLGINPLTGKTANRSIAYEALKQFPGKTFTIAQVVALTGASRHEITPALHGLSINPDNYPGVHRVGRGLYLFDPNKPTTWMTNPNMRRAQMRKSRKPRAAAVKAVTAAVLPAPTLPKGPIFTETLPVFERNGSSITQTFDAFILRDSEGALWQATKI